jgi:adenine-specific DNA-methyltransferase
MLLCDFWDDIDFQNTQHEGGVSFPTAKKPELLLSRIIEMCTNENDIVLDYHLGSGTTAAVALKSNRQFIGIEQLDYGENDSIKRLKNVIDGEQSGVSKAYDWKGGGSFVYAELKKLNSDIVELVEKANNDKTLEKAFDLIQRKGFVSYKVNVSDIDIKSNSFNELSFEDKQRFLIEILDKNQLYLNFSEIEDEDYQVSQQDKNLNHAFYKS